MTNKLQLNVNRARLRRPPAEINSINEPFNPDKFNFNKIKAEEKIFNLIPKSHNTKGKLMTQLFFLFVDIIYFL